MKTLYFDCSSGISENMTLGALIEIVWDENYLINELRNINITDRKQRNKHNREIKKH